MDKTFRAVDSYPFVDRIILQPDSKLLVIGGGSLNGLGTNTHVIRLLPTGEIDPGFSPPVFSEYGYLDAGALQEDGKLLVAGYFTAINGVSFFSLARLNTDGSLDRTFAPNGGPAGYVTQLFVQGDKIIVGGNFSEMNGVPSKGLVRLNLNSVDPPLELSAPKLFNLHPDAGGVAFSVRTLVAWTYDIETAKQMPATDWVKVSSFRGDGFAVASRLEAGDATGSFFRVVGRK